MSPFRNKVKVIIVLNWIKNMALFKIDGSVVRKIIAKDLDLEKNIQSLFENNMGELLNIIFLVHELY